MEEKKRKEKRGSFIPSFFILPACYAWIQQKKNEKGIFWVRTKSLYQENDVILSFGLDKKFGQLGNGQINETFWLMY